MIVRLRVHILALFAFFSVVSSVYFTGEFGNGRWAAIVQNQRVWCGGRVLTRARP